MRRMAALYNETNRNDLPDGQLMQAKYNLAEFIAANQERIYFNDQFWSGFQVRALSVETGGRLARGERDTLIAGQRRLQDEQEERWRAYLILQEVIRDSGKTELGRKAAR